jgi:addiction module HigA family antidote
LQRVWKLRGKRVSKHQQDKWDIVHNKGDCWDGLAKDVIHSHHWPDSQIPAVATWRRSMSRSGPFWRNHPGDLIADELQRNLWAREELARMLGWSTADLVGVVNGRLAITPAMAVDLGRVFETTYDFWLRVQREMAVKNKENCDDVRDGVGV